MATRFLQKLREERGLRYRTRFRPRPALRAVESLSEPFEAFGGEAAVDLARHIYQLRRKRDANFAAELFSEPAWDILLHLFVSAAEGRAVTVSSACDGAAAPQTTALRKLRQLEEARLIVREGDPADARRAYVRLSYLGRRKMRSLLKGGCPEIGQRP
jgi:DNA-binding MarR family transcriptional regulator